MAAKNMGDRPISVYLVTCSVSGKQYVGISYRAADRRWKEHVKAASVTAKSLLSRAIAKYGPDAFVMMVIYEAVDEREACAVERAMIAQYDTLAPRGYNLSTGGEGSVGRRVSKIGRANLSAAVKAQWLDPDFRERMLVAFQDRTIPESHVEHLRQLAAGQKGETRSAEFGAKVSAGLKGHSVSDETKAKIAASHKTRPRVLSDEGRARIVEAHTGRKQSDDAKAKMSEASKARWADPKFRASRTGKKRPEHAFVMKALWDDPEYKARVIAARGPVSEETRAAISAANRGKKKPAQSIAIKARWADPVYRAKHAAAMKASRDKRNGHAMSEPLKEAKNG